MKLTLNVSVKEADQIVRTMIDAAHWAEDEHYKRLPKRERVSRVLKCRDFVSQMLVEATNDAMSDTLRICKELSEHIDWNIKVINEEEE